MTCDEAFLSFVKWAPLYGPLILFYVAFGYYFYSNVYKGEKALPKWICSPFLTVIFWPLHLLVFGFLLAVITYMTKANENVEKEIEEIKRGFAKLHLKDTTITKEKNMNDTNKLPKPFKSIADIYRALLAGTRIVSHVGMLDGEYIYMANDTLWHRKGAPAYPNFSYPETWYVYTPPEAKKYEWRVGDYIRGDILTEEEARVKWPRSEIRKLREMP